jgi:N6-L-threonylcarbamoyladenine synthase
MAKETKMENERLVRILGIETSCDETAAAVVENGRRILSSRVASQIDLHAPYGGVFPEVASRQHIITIHSVVDEALRQAHLSLDDIDAIAVTRGPGLAGSLVVGLNYAKGLSLARNIPLVGVNHLEGHIYSGWVDPTTDEKAELPLPEFPVLVLLVSGGHTELDLFHEHGRYERLGSTLDDAAGEAFDKVARLLGLSYPGGPSIQQAALSGDSAAFTFPRAHLEGTWNFSFSGLKTAVLRVVRNLEKHTDVLPVADLAASFQQAVVDVLFEKTMHAAREYRPKLVLLAGGVSANKALRETFLAQKEFPVRIPPLSLCTDNAVMVASAGYFHYLRGETDRLDMDVQPTWPLPLLKRA